MPCVQVAVKVKTANKQTTQKKTIYGDHIAADITDPQIDAFIHSVQKDFGYPPDVVKTKVTLNLMDDDS